MNANDDDSHSDEEDSIDDDFHEEIDTLPIESTDESELPTKPNDENEPPTTPLGF